MQNPLYNLSELIDLMKEMKKIILQVLTKEHFYNSENFAITTNK